MRTKSAGSVFSGLSGFWIVLCPACVPALGALLSALGLGILADFAVSRGVMLVFLGLAFIILHVSGKAHGQLWPFALAVAAGLLGVFARNVVLNQTLVYVSGAGLVVAAIADFVYRKRAPALVCAAAPPAAKTA